MSNIKLTVGIDLGTTNSECYIYSDVTNQPVLQYLHGSMSGIYPSVVQSVVGIFRKIHPIQELVINLDS